MLIMSLKNKHYKRNVLLLNVMVCGTLVTAGCTLVVHTEVCKSQTTTTEYIVLIQGRYTIIKIHDYH